MKSLLNQLESNEAVLLMYVADELPAADRAAVEQRLTAEPALREQLESILGLHDFTSSSLQAIDNQRMNHGAGARQVVRAMHRWNAGRARERAAQPQKRPFRLYVPAWAYPLTAAAIVAVAFSLWAINVEKKTSTGNKDSVAWTGTDGGGNIFDAPPPDPSSPVAEQYAKLEETLDDSAGLAQMDDQMNTLSDWGSPILPKDVVAQ